MKKSGAWYTYEGEQMGQGRENAKSFLAENPELMVEISDKIFTKAGINTTGPPEPATGDLDPDDQPIQLD